MKFTKTEKIKVSDYTFFLDCTELEPLGYNSRASMYVSLFDTCAKVRITPFMLCRELFVGDTSAIASYIIDNNRYLKNSKKLKRFLLETVDLEKVDVEEAASFGDCNFGLYGFTEDFNMDRVLIEENISKKSCGSIYRGCMKVVMDRLKENRKYHFAMKASKRSISRILNINITFENMIILQHMPMKYAIQYELSSSMKKELIEAKKKICVKAMEQGVYYDEDTMSVRHVDDDTISVQLLSFKESDG